MADGLAATFELVSAVLKLSAENKLDEATAASALDFLENDFDVIFDCFPEVVKLNDSATSEINKMLDLRVKARADKNWDESDRLRDDLLEKYNVEVRDGSDGQTWCQK